MVGQVVQVLEASMVEASVEVALDLMTFLKQYLV